MHLERLWLVDYRSYTEAEFGPAPTGITLVTGENGAGKTNLIEAIGYVATLRSLRGSPTEALVRAGADTAVVRAAGERGGRRLNIDTEIHAAGRNRAQLNGQPLRRARDLLDALQVTLFSPDDLVMVKGGPQFRRDFLDDLLVALHRRHDATISEVERVLKQRNALLKSASSSFRGSVVPDDVAFTLDVWDTKLATAGEDLAAARAAVIEALEPLAEAFYRRLATGAAARGRDSIGFAYRRSWDGLLHEALTAARRDDLRRGVTTVGPHRDDMDLTVGTLPARTHASQGEQRCLALALRLAGHQLLTDRLDSVPILLLDDVFSELDPVRADALLTCLPPGQAVLTTAGHVPEGAETEVRARFRVEDGKLLS